MPVGKTRTIHFLQLEMSLCTESKSHTVNEVLLASQKCRLEGPD